MTLSPKMLDFLVENRIHNSREWFHENKQRYYHDVLKPFQELVIQVTPDMLKIDSKFITEPKVDKTISRVYRDIRFSKDKSLYRENIWFVFMRHKKLYCGFPAFFLDVSPDEFSYGCGYYQASTQSMTAIRELILDKDQSFLKAQEAYCNQTVFHLEGERYKRSKFPQQSEQMQNWLERRNLSFVHTSKDFDLLFSDHLAEHVCRDYFILTPIYSFLCKAECFK